MDVLRHERDLRLPTEDSLADWKVKKEFNRKLAIEQRSLLESRLRHEGERIGECSLLNWEESHEKHAEILRACAEPLVLNCKGCGKKKLVNNGCDKRWCPVCAPKLASQKIARYALAVQSMQWPLFLTLTLPNMQDIAEMFTILKRAWKSIRRSKWWQHCDVKGGVYAIEVTNIGNGWHLHLHILMDCRWLAVHARAPRSSMQKEETKRCTAAAQAELCEAWEAASGVGARIAYVSRADNGSIKEALKYSVKPGDLVAMKTDPLPLILAMRRARMTQCWGSLFGMGAEFRAMEQADREQCQCDACGGVEWKPMFESTTPPQFSTPPPAPKKLGAKEIAIEKKRDRERRAYLDTFAAEGRRLQAARLKRKAIEG